MEMKEKGFTLIELMIVVSFIGFLVFASYGAQWNMFQFQTKQERETEMQLRLQLAMDLLVSDIRSAGLGTMDPRDRGDQKGLSPSAGVLPNIPVDQFNPIVPENNVPVDGFPGLVADVITLTGAKQFVGLLGESTNPSTNPTTLVVNPLPGAPQLIVPGNLITIGGFFASQVAGIVDNSVTLVSPLGQNNSEDTYPFGMPVYRTQTLRYTVGASPIAGDTEPALLMGGQLVATGIEDLQVAYLLNPVGGGIAVNTPVVNDGNFAGAKNGYLAVRVSLVARTMDRDPNFMGGAHPLLEDNPKGPADRFRRAVLTRVIELVNDGCGPSDRHC